MSLVREICQSDIKDLTVVSYGGPDIGLLCAHKKVKKLIFGFVSLDVIPLEAHFRQARQNKEIEVMELDEGMLQWGLRSAAMNLPFLPTRVGFGTDVLTHNPELKFVTSPFQNWKVCPPRKMLKIIKSYFIFCPTFLILGSSKMSLSFFNTSSFFNVFPSLCLTGI